MSEYVRIDQQDVSEALTAWDDHAVSLQDGRKVVAAKFLEAHGNGKWIGNDEAGRIFREKFQPDKIEEFFGPPTGSMTNPNAADVIQTTLEHGHHMRRATSNSLASDGAQAHAFHKTQKQVDIASNSTASVSGPVTSPLPRTPSRGQELERPHPHREPSHDRAPFHIAPVSETPSKALDDRTSQQPEDTLWHIDAGPVTRSAPVVNDDARVRISPVDTGPLNPEHGDHNEFRATEYHNVVPQSPEHVGPIRHAVTGPVSVDMAQPTSIPSAGHDRDHVARPGYAVDNHGAQSSGPLGTDQRPLESSAEN